MMKVLTDSQIYPILKIC